MIRNHVIAIIIYSLAFPIGCKNRSVRSSTVKEVPTSKTAIEGLLSEDANEKERGVVKDFSKVVNELGIAGTLPMVVVDWDKIKRNEIKYRRDATAKEILGVDPLQESEELFFGSPRSRYLIGIRPTKSRGASADIKLAVKRYDTKGVFERGSFAAQDGVPLNIKTTGTPEEFRNQINRKMTALNSLLADPTTDADVKRAQERLMTLHNDYESRNIPTYKTLTVIFGVLFLALAVFIGLETYYRFSFITTKMIQSILVLCLIAFVAFIALGVVTWYKTSNAEELVVRMEEIVFHYGDRGVKVPQ